MFNDQEEEAPDRVFVLTPLGGTGYVEASRNGSLRSASSVHVHGDVRMTRMRARPIVPYHGTQRHRPLASARGILVLLAAWLSLLATALVVPFCQAATLLDVPLKPWTYFETNRDWTYTAIEKLVTAGVVGPWVLNTKPISRIEMARIVALAVRKIREDEVGRFTHRSDLEPVLYRLMEELAPELEALGIGRPNGEAGGLPWLALQPLWKVQARGAWAQDAEKPENSQGLSLASGWTGLLDFSSWLQVGDFLSGYIHPQFQVDEDDYEGRILEGYLKLKLWNLSILAGRESVWWGPGYHGAMLFNNNAPPLDQIRIGMAEPILLPWIFRYLGPFRAELLYARLESNRDHPNAMLGSWRIDMTPLPFFEFGFSRTVQFGGDGRPSLNPIDYLLVLFVSSDDRNSKYDTNQLYSLDGTFRLHDVDRVFPVTRDLVLYAELGVDDTCCNNILWPFKPGYLVGVYFPNFLRRENTELRIEWAATTSFSFTNSIYSNGISFKGYPIAHYIGAKGQDFYGRLTERLLPNLQVGLEGGFAKVGTTNISQVNLPREERWYVGIDSSYQPTKNLSFYVGYRYENRKNVDLATGQNEINHIVQFGITYSFPVWGAGQIGRPSPKAKDRN